MIVQQCRQLRRDEIRRLLDEEPDARISEENVKTRLHRARALLRDDLFGRTGAATSGAFQFHLSRCDRVVAGVLEKIAAPSTGHESTNV